MDNIVLTKKEQATFSEKVASRKFIFTLFVCVGCTALVANGSIDNGTYAQIMNVAIVSYMCGNVAQAAISKPKG